MRIFGLVIKTRKRDEAEKQELVEAMLSHYDAINFAIVNPVVHDLEKLRANTWDQDKITHMQEWLSGHFGIDE